MLPSKTSGSELTTIQEATSTVATSTPIQIQKDLWIQKLGQCENNRWPTLRRIVDSNGYYSYGQYMFQMGTWLAYGKPFGATKENIYDADLQKKVAESMLDAGLFYHWKTCSAKASKQVGPYPSEQ